MTALAPAVDIRLNMHAIRQQRTLLTQSPIFEKLCQSIPKPVLILNGSRQIVWANQETVKLMNIGSDSVLYGSRLEDFIKDSHLNSESGADPFEVEDELFYLIILEDTSSDALRQNLERTFFHDLLNTAGGMQGLTGILQDATDDELPELKDSVQNMADQLVEEILSQRDLLAAEMGELKAHKRLVTSGVVINTIINNYRTHSSTGIREIVLAEDAENFGFFSDPTLLNRVLGNMVKNAIEASKAPAVTTINCGKEGNEVWFSVHNDGFIPRSIQPSVFQQSFSTKGKGRGTGTFSMRLFTEQYLDGRIRFKSDPAAGTIFTIILPIGGL